MPPDHGVARVHPVRASASAAFCHTSRVTNRRAIVVCPPKELNQHTLEAFEAEVEPHVAPVEGEDSARPGIVFDLRELEFVNSTGLGYMVAIGKRLSEQNRRLALACATKQIDKLIRMVGLNQVLPMFKALAEAAIHVERR